MNKNLVFLAFYAFFLMLAAPWLLVISGALLYNPSLVTAFTLLSTLLVPFIGYRVIYNEYFCYCSDRRVGKFALGRLDAPKPPRVDDDPRTVSIQFGPPLGEPNGLRGPNRNGGPVIGDDE